jgi:ABC-type transport system involved in cytochrome bd biosynthesis fused ATPase/permease subunit
MDPRTNGKVSGSSMAFIMLTNFLTPLIAAALSYIIKPGIKTITHRNSQKYQIFSNQFCSIIKSLPFLKTLPRYDDQLRLLHVILMRVK